MWASEVRWDWNNKEIEKSRSSEYKVKKLYLNEIERRSQDHQVDPALLGPGLVVLQSQVHRRVRAQYKLANVANLQVGPLEWKVSLAPCT